MKFAGAEQVRIILLLSLLKRSFLFMDRVQISDRAGNPTFRVGLPGPVDGEEFDLLRQSTNFSFSNAKSANVLFLPQPAPCTLFAVQAHTSSCGRTKAITRTVIR